MTNLQDEINRYLNHPEPQIRDYARKVFADLPRREAELRDKAKQLADELIAKARRITDG